MVQRDLASHFIRERKVFSSHSCGNTTFNKYVEKMSLRQDTLNQALNQDDALDVKKFTDYTVYVESWFSQ